MLTCLPLWADVEVMQPKNYTFTILCNDGIGELRIPLTIFTISGYGKASIETVKEFSACAEEFNSPKIKNNKKIYDTIKKDKRFVGIKLSVELSPTKEKNVFNAKIKFSNSEFQGFYEDKNYIMPIISFIEIHHNATMFLDKTLELPSLVQKPLDNNDTLNKKSKTTYKCLLSECTYYVDGVWKYRWESRGDIEGKTPIECYDNFIGVNCGPDAQD